MVLPLYIIRRIFTTTLKGQLQAVTSTVELIGTFWVLLCLILIVKNAAPYNMVIS